MRLTTLAVMAIFLPARIAFLGFNVRVFETSEAR